MCFNGPLCFTVFKNALVESLISFSIYSSKADPVGKKDLKKIQAEIRDVMRQVTASVSFLPLLESVCM